VRKLQSLSRKFLENFDVFLASEVILRSQWNAEEPRTEFRPIEFMDLPADNFVLSFTKNMDLPQECTSLVSKNLFKINHCKIKLF
jgi:hypothetical protein